MNDEEIEKLEKEIEIEYRIRLEVKKHIDRVVNLCWRGIIPQPKGIFIKRCPKCEAKLRKERIYDALLESYIAHYSCDCDYEYAH